MKQRLIEDMFELCIILVDIAALFSVNRIKWYLDILPGKWWAKQISCNISCSSMECYSFILSHQLNKDYVLGDELRGSKINVMS